MSTETDAPLVEIFDSLPYYDDDLQKYPYLREKVEQELARELKASQTLHPRVPPPEELFAVRERVCLFYCSLLTHDHLGILQDNPLLKAELQRVGANQAFPPLDSLRHSLPAPTSTPGTDEEWKAALDNAHVQLQHQKIRYVVLMVAIYQTFC